MNKSDVLEERIRLPDRHHELRIVHTEFHCAWTVFQRGGIEVLHGTFSKDDKWEDHLALIKELANKKFAAPRDKAVTDYFRSYKR